MLLGMRVLVLVVIVKSLLVLGLGISLPCSPNSSGPIPAEGRTLLTTLPSMYRSMRQSPHLQPRASHLSRSGMRLCLDFLVNSLHLVRLCRPISVFFVSLIRLGRVSSFLAFLTFLFRRRSRVLIIPISRVFRLLETFSSLQILGSRKPGGFTESRVLSTGCTWDRLKGMERGVPLMAALAL